MIKLKTQALLALLFATSMPLMQGCKELNDQKSNASDISEVTEPENTVGNPDPSQPTFEPIQINTAPQDLSGYPGQTATFTIGATSADTLSYQWYADDRQISGATGSSFTFAINDTSDAGIYRVDVSNATNTVTESAQLFVSELPNITDEPSDVSIYPGESATFTISTSGDDVEYQWQARSLFGWSTLDETSDTLIVENVSTSTKKQYRVKVKNNGGEKTSRTTRINLKNPISISSQPTSQLIAEGENAAFSVSASGYGTLHYQWLKAGSAISDGSKFQGAQSASLSVLNVSSADASLYSVVISNDDGRSMSSAFAELSVQGPAVVTVQPNDTTLYSGSSGELIIAASGDGPITYQWQKWNGSSWQSISGANSNRLGFSNITSNTAGRYRCSISNTVSGDLSNVATITVLQAVAITQSPSSTSVQEGESVSFSVTATGENLQYEWTKDGQVLPDSSSSLSFASVRELDEATYGCRVYNEGGSTECSAFSLTVQSPVAINTQPTPQNTYEGGSVTLSVSASGDPAPLIEWYFQEELISTGSTLTLNNITLEQAGSYQCLAKNDINSVYCAPATINVSSSVTISSQPSSTDINEGSSINLAVIATGEDLNYDWLKDGVSLGVNSPTLDISAANKEHAGSYSCRIWNEFSSATCEAFTVSVNSEVSITQAPTDVTVFEDQPVSLQVEHDGGTNTKVSWYFNDTLMSSEGSTLTLASVSLTQAGEYRCVVANTVNSEACPAITVTVMEKARITKQPSSQVLTEGDTLIFDIEASGAAPLTYRCYFGDSLLVTSSTASDLVVPAIQSGDEGQYYCTVSNDGALATSESITVSVVSLTREILISWTPPALRADESVITPDDISHYKIYTATSQSGPYALTKTTSGPEPETTISGLQLGTLYIVVTTVDKSDLESGYSEVSAVEIQ